MYRRTHFSLPQFVEVLMNGSNRCLGRDPGRKQLARFTGDLAGKTTTASTGTLDIDEQNRPPTAQLLDRID
jgi:hypothetical protein